MQVSVGQSKLMRQASGTLPKWWKLYEKENPQVRQQIASCVAVVTAREHPTSLKKTASNSRHIEGRRPKDDDEEEYSLEDAEDAMGIPRGTLDFCMGAD